jgi:cell division protease FtsH
MSDLGPVYYEVHEAQPFLGARIATDGGASDETLHAIEDASRELLGRSLDTAMQMLSRHRAQLDKLVVALLANETLERDALDALLGPREPGPGVVPVEAPIPPMKPARA